MPLKFRAVFMFVFALALVAQTGFTQESKDDPILARMKKDIYFLASDECEGRGVGTLGLDLAAHYIAAQFKKAGLQPGGLGGTYFQPFPFATGAQQDGESTLILTGPQGEKIELKQGTDFQVIGTSGPGKVNAPLVFAGFGVTANKTAYDDFAGIDVKGKAIITLRRLPRFADKEKPFDGASKDELNVLAALDNKQNRGEAKQAAAVILVNDASELPKDNLTAFQITKAISTVSVPYVHVKRAVIDEIIKKSIGTNLADTEKAINDDLKPRSAALQGWNVQLDVRIKRTEVPVKNVIGVIEGKGPLANEIIVVGAHYDHLGYGMFGSLAKDKKGTIHYGADDNGSGSTAVMELARRFGAMKDRQGRKIVFMTFTAEERGLIGSRHYTRVAPMFPLKDTAAMFNLDMVGRVKEPTQEGVKPKLHVLGMDSSKGFKDLLNKHNPGFDLFNDKSVFGASDHYSFYLQRIPVLFFFTGTHPEYHRPTDTADKINVAGMKRVADYAEKIIAEWAADPKRPEYAAITTGFTPGPKGPKFGILPDYTFGGKGVFVEAVTQGGPAAQAGIMKGDVIVAIAGKSIGNVDGYMTALAQQKSGVALEVRILRNGKEMDLKVTPK